MKFFYKVDGEHFDTPCYYKDYTSALYYMMQYAQRFAHGNEALDYASERKFGWEFVYVEKIYFEGEEKTNMFIQECMAFNGQETEAFLKTREALNEICSYYQKRGKGCEACMFSEGCAQIFSFLTNAIEDERVVLDIVAKE